jgi:hypothetical protein
MSSWIELLKSFLTYGDKIVYMTLAILIASFVIETSLIKIVPFYHKYSDIAVRVLVFLIIFGISMIGQVIVLIYSARLHNKRDPSIIRKALYVCQGTISIMLSLIILQIIFMSRIYTNLLVVSVTISYIFSSITFAVLTWSFWSWYMSNKNPVVLSYAICCLALTCNLLISVTFVDILLGQRQEVLFPQLGLSDRFITTDNTMNFLHYSYILSSILAFIAAWVASVLLLHHYSARKGTLRSWVLLILPLIFFISQFVALFLNLFPNLVGQNAVFFGNLLTIIYTISRTLGGILFGIAFWNISRYIRQNDIVRKYLTRSAYGFILLFVSNQAIVLISTNYPPFGILTTSFLPVASYLLFTGIYSTAVSVSQDLKLRRSIKRSIEKELLFVDSIAVAQMHKQIQSKVLATANKLSAQINEETGIANSLTDEDIKSYINEVIESKIARSISE